MHATLVLLDVGEALRTWLTVGLNPCKIFRIRLFFFVPFLNLFAMSWLMFFFHTFETKAVTALTLNDIFLSKVILFDDVVTVLLWTPLDLPVMICELLAMPQ
jgi:hypothetical protein